MAERTIRTNWAGNVRYAAAALHRPATLEELQELVARSRRVKVVGTRHSFNGIADTPGDHISMEKFDRILALDRAAGTVTIEGGVRYGELGHYLHQAGFALHNLASLPHLSVAGAVATATHGSGERLGNLATAVTALEIVCADGSVRRLSRAGDATEFAGAVVSLGALGVVTKLTLEIEPTYAVRQCVFENLSRTQFDTGCDAIMAAADSVSLFTHWRDDRFHQVWLKRRVGQGGDPGARDFLGLTAATADVHPISGHAAENCTPQLDLPGPWHERLPHFRLEFTPSSGNELQSEYFVPRRHAQAAWAALAPMAPAIAPLLHVSEVRTIAADDLWLSPCYQQSCMALHFTWQPDGPGVRALLPEIEARLAPFDVRPHWGKCFALSREHLEAAYIKLPEFRALVRRYDPEGKFQNRFLQSRLGGEPPQRFVT